jgi:cyclohexa-1,5-dienecarbonyl-CoA hydratase
VKPDRGIDLEIGAADRIARLRIRLPPVNVLRLTDLELLARRVEESREAAVLIVNGLPQTFSAGVDVADHTPEAESIERMLRAMRRVLEALVETPAITIAAVSGACLGGGAEIVCACDLVIAAEDARIGFPEIGLACFPPGAAALLPLRIGSARAWDWILTGRVVSGREAAHAGFATRRVDSGSVGIAAERMASEVTAKSPAAVGAIRSLIRQERRDALTRILPRAEEAYRGLAGNPDLAKAVEQFLKKN